MICIATLLALLGFDHTKPTIATTAAISGRTDNYGQVVKDIIAQSPLCLPMRRFGILLSSPFRSRARASRLN
jgi:hypothetical protein